MTIPGNLNPIKTPTTPGSMSTGPTMTQVVVRSLNTEASPPVAICEDNVKRQIPVRMDIQRGKGSIPAVGEFWVIDKSMGGWTFLAYLGGNPTGAGMTSIEGVAGLSDALAQAQGDLDDHHARLDTMWTQGTITAVQGATNADVKLTDGTVCPGCLVVGTYAPVVGDLVWTAAVDGGAGRAIVGVSGSSAASEQVTNLTATGSIITGGPLTALGKITGAGGFSLTGGATIDSVGITGTLTCAGWRLLYDRFGNSVIITGPGGSGIASGGTSLVAVTASDTAVHADFTARTLTSDGVIHAGSIDLGVNPIYAGAGAFTGIQVSGSIATNGLNSSSLRIGTAPAPAANQIQTIDMTANNNINVLGTFFYRSVAQNMNPASERRLKIPKGDLGKEQVERYLSGLRPGRFKWKDEKYHDSDQHVGVYVDEMDLLDPDTVQHPVFLHDPNLTDRQRIRMQGNSGRMPKPQALIAYLVRGWQEHREEIDELRAQVDALREQLRGEEVADADPGAGER